MAMNDPLGDMLTRIRNAQMRKRGKVSTPGSSLRKKVLDVLEFGRLYPRLFDYGLRQWPHRVRNRAEIFRRPAGHP